MLPCLLVYRSSVGRLSPSKLLAVTSNRINTRTVSLCAGRVLASSNFLAHLYSLVFPLRRVAPMSNRDVFMSSSPRTERADRHAVASSSPDLPSLTEIFAKNLGKPPLKSKSSAAPLPASAPQTSTSTAALLREAAEIDIDTEQITKSPLKPKSVNGLLERLISGTLSSPDESSSNSAMKQPAIVIESSPKEKPWQKFKSRTPTPEAKPPLSKARVTKAIAKDRPSNEKLRKDQPSKPRQARSDTGTVSKHFSTKEDSQLIQAVEEVEGHSERVKSGPRLNDIKPISLPTADAASCSEPALRRRVDWTPPPADDAILITSDDDHKELVSSVDPLATTSKTVFHGLRDNFTYKNSSATSLEAQQPPLQLDQQYQPELLKKRKRLDMVAKVASPAEPNVQSRETSHPKPAATKKKIRTITELATAPYLPPPEPEFDLSTRTTRDSLLEYFDAGDEVKALIEHQSVVMSKNKETAKPTKAKAKPRKKKAGTADAPILLSPNSALKVSSHQDFVFGTSSQLVGDESPTTLRHLQLAIQASNKDEDPFGKPDSHGRLWQAGARDNDGDLMEVEVVDLAQTPVLPKPPSTGIAQNGEQRSFDQPKSDDFVDVDNIPLDTPCAKSIVPAAPSAHSVPNHISPTPSASAVPNRLVAANSSDASAPRPPNYEKLTDAQLAKQIKSYGFKPVKKRQAMIALLDQCWASKNPAVSSMQAQPISTTTTVASPKRKEAAPPAPPAAISKEPAKRPRGRPKKNPDATIPSPTRGRPKKTAAAATASTSVSTATASKSRKETSKKSRTQTKKTTRKAKEIADSTSEGEGEASPVSGSAASSPKLGFSSPPPIDLDLELDTAAEDGLSLSLPPDARQTELFRYITQAVKTAPRSEDPAHPSWHEMMLLYDPVVLEDLAAWLNAGQLTRVGFDGEASPMDVKKWCEARSIVCLWRTTSRGRERKRY